MRRLTRRSKPRDCRDFLPHGTRTSSTSLAARPGPPRSPPAGPCSREADRKRVSWKLAHDRRRQRLDTARSTAVNSSTGAPSATRMTLPLFPQPALTFTDRVPNAQDLGSGRPPHDASQRIGLAVCASLKLVPESRGIGAWQSPESRIESRLFRLRAALRTRRPRVGVLQGAPFLLLSQSLTSAVLASIGSRLLARGPLGSASRNRRVCNSLQPARTRHTAPLPFSCPFAATRAARIPRARL